MTSNIQFEVNPDFSCAAGDVSSSVCKHEVVFPSHKDLASAITTLTVHVKPFKELVEFRRSCFNGMFSVIISLLTFTP